MWFNSNVVARFIGQNIYTHPTLKMHNAVIASDERSEAISLLEGIASAIKLPHNDLSAELSFLVCSTR